jgi:hypothetical protein
MLLGLTYGRFWLQVPHHCWCPSASRAMLAASSADARPRSRSRTSHVSKRSNGSNGSRRRWKSNVNRSIGDVKKEDKSELGPSGEVGEAEAQSERAAVAETHDGPSLPAVRANAIVACMASLPICFPSNRTQ